MIERIVISGGPCSGKTTILNVLEKRGYTILPEAARVVIEDEQRIGGNAFPWENVSEFQKKVLGVQKDLDSKVSSLVFMDRSAVDGLGYYENAGLVPAQDLLDYVGQMRYDKVFFLEPLDIYRTDSDRKENEVVAKKVSDFLWNAYVNQGYSPIRVPKMDVEERVKFILGFL